MLSITLLIAVSVVCCYVSQRCS